jgi:hypothetical protein
VSGHKTVTICKRDTIYVHYRVFTSECKPQLDNLRFLGAMTVLDMPFLPLTCASTGQTKGGISKTVIASRKRRLSSSDLHSELNTL